MPTIEYCAPWPPQRLTKLQLELECIAVEHGKLLVRIPCANPDDIPRVLVTHHGDIYRSYFRHDLPQRVLQELEMLAPQQAFEDPETVRRLLSLDRPCADHVTFQSYVFPQTLSQDLYPDAVRLPELNTIGGPVFGMVIDGQVVSACTSVRENARCAEAWVWTLPAFQRRGYARQVTSAWAHDLQLQSKLPFYSHKVSNLASAAVAWSLALVHFATATAYA